MAGPRRRGAVRLGPGAMLQSACHRALPTLDEPLAVPIRHPWHELRVPHPSRTDVVEGREHTGLEPREAGGAERGGLDGPRPLDRDVDDVGERLQQPGVPGHAAVDPETANRRSAIGLHRGHEVAGLEADGLQRGAGEMRGTGVAGETMDRATGVRVPVRCPQTGERGNEVDTAGIGEAAREGFRLRRILDDSQPVAQPLHGGAGDEDRALQGVGRLAREAPGDGGQQPVPRPDRLRAGVHDCEAAGAVGALRHAGREAGLPDRRRLLVACDSRDGEGVPEDFHRRGPEIGGTVPHFGKHALRHIEEPQQGFVPRLRVDVEEQGARRIGGVGGVDGSAGEAPDEEGVDGAEREIARHGACARTIDVVEDPCDLAGGETGIEQQPGLLARRRLVPGVAQHSALRHGAAILPHDGAVDGSPARSVPYHRGLALVGDADGGDGAVCRSECLAGDREGRRSDLLRIVLHPAAGRVVLRKLAPGNGANRTVEVEHDRTRAGRALVDGQQQGRIGHVVLLDVSFHGIVGRRLIADSVLRARGPVLEPAIRSDGAAARAPENLSMPWTREPLFARRALPDFREGRRQAST